MIVGKAAWPDPSPYRLPHERQVVEVAGRQRPIDVAADSKSDAHGRGQRRERLGSDERPRIRHCGFVVSADDVAVAYEPQESWWRSGRPGGVDAAAARNGPPLERDTPFGPRRLDDEGMARVSASERLIKASAGAGLARQSPGTMTYPPILCPAIGSKSRPPCFLTAVISVSGNLTTSSSPKRPQNMFPFTNAESWPNIGLSVMAGSSGTSRVNAALASSLGLGSFIAPRSMPSIVSLGCTL